MLFMAVQALFNETLFQKCPDMCRPRYTPVAPPVDAQDEYNIPPEDNGNGDHGGVPFGPAQPGRFVPYQAPLPGPPPKNQGKGPNPDPLVSKKPTPPGPTPSELESDDFYVPKTPPPRAPFGDPDSSHRFFNPNPDPCDPPLYDSKEVMYGNLDGSPSLIQYNYRRHGRHLSWDWHKPTAEQWYNPDTPIQGWYHRAGHPDLDDTVFKEFL